MALFIIKGEPVAIKAHHLDQRYWDHFKQSKLDAQNKLEKQLNGFEPLRKPVNLELGFYFEPKGLRKPAHPSKLSHEAPDISDLIKFVECVTNGILFRDPSIISSITSFKRYSNDARTEIIITEIKND